MRLPDNMIIYLDNCVCFLPLWWLKLLRHPSSLTVNWRLCHHQAVEIVYLFCQTVSFTKHRKKPEALSVWSFQNNISTYLAYLQVILKYLRIFIWENFKDQKRIVSTFDDFLNFKTITFYKDEIFCLQIYWERIAKPNRDDSYSF